MKNDWRQFKPRQVSCNRFFQAVVVTMHDEDTPGTFTVSNSGLSNY